MGCQGEQVRCLRFVFHSPLSLRRQKTNHHIPEPSTATVLGRVANCALEDFQTAIKSAEVAQTKFWESTTGNSRGALLKKWYELVMANKDDRT